MCEKQPLCSKAETQRAKRRENTGNDKEIAEAGEGSHSAKIRNLSPTLSEGEEVDE